MIKRILALTLCFFISFSVFAQELTDNSLLLVSPAEFSQVSASEWVNLETQILTTTSRYVILEWRGYGGIIAMEHEFVDVLERAKDQGKTIIFKLVGESYSAHSLAVCHGNIVLNRINLLMFHADAFVFGNIQIVVPRERSGIQDDLNYCAKQNIITYIDIDRIYSGFEVWVYGPYKIYKKDPRV